MSFSFIKLLIHINTYITLHSFSISTIATKGKQDNNLS